MENNNVTPPPTDGPHLQLPPRQNTPTPPPHLARHHLLPLSCPPLNTDALHHLRGRRPKIILKGILTRMELDETEEII